MYIIILKEVRAAIEGTVAKPSRPSVKFTAFDVAIITKTHNII